jgi:hypothetical protein
MSSDGATFSRLHVWSQNEQILPSDLNAEFDNVLNNFTFEGLDDYELNVTQMRAQTSPGGVGTESLATSGAGELERIRFVLARLQGTTYWYEGPAISLAQANTLLSLSGTIPPNRLDSGAALLLQASAVANSVTLKGSVTPFAYHIGGISYLISSDVTFAGLTLGSSGNASKVLVNDVSLTAQESSKTQGENQTVITFDTDGTHTGGDFGGRLNKLSAFRIVHGANTEYFLATPTSATTLANAQRGAFFDATGVPIPRIAIADEDVITLMSLAYLFVTAGGALSATYNAPTYADSAPAIAFAGDYWLDLTTQVWMIFNGSSWVTANATFVGMAIQDSVKTVGTRSGDFFAGYNALNSIVLTLQDSTHIAGASVGEQVSVAGHVFTWSTTVPIWASTGQFAPGASLLPSTAYYVYVTNTGALLLDVIAPYNRVGDLGGFYHPYNAWRAIGFFSTDAGSLFLAPTTYNSSGVGQGPFNSITGAQIAPHTVTVGNMELKPSGTSVSAGGIALAALPGSFITNSGSLVDVTGSSIALITTGRPVRVELLPSSVGGYLNISSITALGAVMRIAILRDGVIVSSSIWGGFVNGGAAPLYVPASVVAFLDPAPAGSHTYKMQVLISPGGGGTNAEVVDCQFVAYEI